MKDLHIKLSNGPASQLENLKTDLNLNTTDTLTICISMMYNFISNKNVKWSEEELESVYWIRDIVYNYAEGLK